MKSFFSSQRKSPSSASSSFSFCIITLFFILFLALLYSEDFSCILNQPFLKPQGQENSDQQQNATLQEENVVMPFAVGRTDRGCNVFEGRWVYDEESRPLYEEEECPYIQPQLTCQAHGRPDKEYQHWRWQPHGCPLPRYEDFLQEALAAAAVLGYSRNLILWVVLILVSCYKLL